MLFINVQDFYNKAYQYKILLKEEERAYATKMKSGDQNARQTIINSYLPMIARFIERLDDNYQSLELVYRCIQALEKCVDQFNFQQDGETFAHRFNWYLRQTITKYIVDSRL